MSENTATTRTRRWTGCRARGRKNEWQAPQGDCPPPGAPFVSGGAVKQRQEGEQRRLLVTRGSSFAAGRQPGCVAYAPFVPELTVRWELRARRTDQPPAFHQLLSKEQQQIRRSDVGQRKIGLPWMHWFTPMRKLGSAIRLLTCLQRAPRSRARDTTARRYGRERDHVTKGVTGPTSA